MHTVTEPTMGRQLLTARRRAWIAALLGAALLAPAGAAFAAAHDTTLVSRASGRARRPTVRASTAARVGRRPLRRVLVECDQPQPGRRGPGLRPLSPRPRQGHDRPRLARDRRVRGQGRGASYLRRPGDLRPTATLIAFMADAREPEPKTTRTPLDDIFVRDLDANETIAGLAGFRVPTASRRTSPRCRSRRSRPTAGSWRSGRRRRTWTADQPTVAQVYVRDLADRARPTLVSRATRSRRRARRLPRPSFRRSRPTAGSWRSPRAANLSPADHNTRPDVYLRDLAGRRRPRSCRAPRARLGADAGGLARHGDLGRRPLRSRSSSTRAKLSPADGGTNLDVYVRNLATSTTTLVSRATGAAGARGRCATRVLSVDLGRWTARRVQLARRRT